MTAECVVVCVQLQYVVGVKVVIPKKRGENNINKVRVAALRFEISGLSDF